MAERALRVAYLDHCARLSGGELSLARLLPALEGVRAHVILAEDGPLVERLRADGISVEVLPLAEPARGVGREAVTPGGLPVRSAALSLAYAARLARRLRRLRADVVHTNSLKAALYGCPAARAARLPVVWHLRDRIADDYLPAPTVRLVRGATRWLPSAVIANSRATLATVAPLRRPGYVIPSPVDLPPAPATAASQSGGLVVGMVGRIAPWKGQDVFLDAFARAFGAGDTRALVMGAPLFGEEDHLASLRERATRLGIAGRVDFAGFVADVPARMRELDVLVHASVIPEPFGQVVVEGMAAGVPVVAADAGGPAEVVRDGVDGLLCPPGDVAALAERLTRLAADPGLRLRLGAAGRITALGYAAAAIAPRVVEVYRRVLAA